jgi:hypothetical protein
LFRALFRALLMGTGLHRSRFGTLLLQTVHAFRQARPSVYAMPGADAGPSSRPTELPDTSDVLAAFKVGGGVGDHLIAARYIRDLVAAVGDFRFDIYSSRPETATWIFGGMPQFNRSYDEYFCWSGNKYYKQYAVSMWVSQFIVLYYDSIKWVTLNSRSPRLVRICEFIDRFRNARDMNEIIHAHPRLDGLLGTKAVFMNLNRHNFAHAMSGIPYGGHLYSLPVDATLREKFGLQSRPYVTIHNGFDSEFQTAYGFAHQSTKIYPHFGTVLSLLRARYPDLFVVQLGSTTSRRIEGVDMALLNKTTLGDATAILAGSTLHIDNESGLVHLAACIGTVSCVVFGPTPPAYFGYERNINIAPHVCGGCWWTTKDWMTHCPRGFEPPVCLSETPPQAVADAILAFLDARPVEVASASGASLPAMAK